MLAIKSAAVGPSPLHQRNLSNEELKVSPQQLCLVSSILKFWNLRPSPLPHLKSFQIWAELIFPPSWMISARIYAAGEESNWMTRTRQRKSVTFSSLGVWLSRGFWMWWRLWCGGHNGECVECVVKFFLSIYRWGTFVESFSTENWGGTLFQGSSLGLGLLLVKEGFKVF